jgi:AcrR family transcriptional regulator
MTDVFDHSSSTKDRPTDAVAKKANDRRRDIVHAALRCLKDSGYAALTARKVALDAGMSLGNITYHFDSMDALLCAAYQLGAEQMHQTVQTPQHSLRHSALDRLEAFLWAGFRAEILVHSHLRLQVDLWSAASENPVVAKIEADLYDRFRIELEILLKAVGDKWKADRVVMVADMIMATYDGLWLDYLRRGNEIALKNGIEGCLLFARMRLGA